MIVGLRRSWLTMDDDSPSITCPGCLLSLSSASYGCRDQCESDKLGHIGCICVLALACRLPFPFGGLTSLLLPLSASFHQTAAVCEGASPAGAVSSKLLPGIDVDVKCPHVSLACILVPQLRAANASLP